jgi:arsenate reductase
MKKKVLFICNHNAGRSQIAEGILNYYYGDKYEAFSAGLNPTESVNPYTIKVLREIGIDISGKTPLHVSKYRDEKFDEIVIACDYDLDNHELPATERITEKKFPDPYLFTGSDDEILKSFRGIRDEIMEWTDKEFTGDNEMNNNSDNGNENNNIHKSNFPDDNECRPVTVTVYVSGDPSEPPLRCPDTDRLLSEVVKDTDSIMKKQGFEIRYEERPKSENTTESLLLIDNRPIEQLVPLPDPSKYCGMACAECSGKPADTPCSRIYENIPESVLRLAVKKAADYIDKIEN